MNVTHFKEGDSLPNFTAVLQTGSGSDAEVINLTGCTVRFSMTSVIGQQAKVSAAATIDNPLLGTVRYDWAVDDLDTPGDYEAEWEITYPSGKKLTVPSAGYDTIRVLGEIA